MKSPLPAVFLATFLSGFWCGNVAGSAPPDIPLKPGKELSGATFGYPRPIKPALPGCS